MFEYKRLVVSLSVFGMLSLTATTLFADLKCSGVWNFSGKSNTVSGESIDYTMYINLDNTQKTIAMIFHGGKRWRSIDGTSPVTSLLDSTNKYYVGSYAVFPSNNSPTSYAVGLQGVLVPDSSSPTSKEYSFMKTVTSGMYLVDNSNARTPNIYQGSLNVHLTCTKP